MCPITQVDSLFRSRWMNVNLWNGKKIIQNWVFHGFSFRFIHHISIHKCVEVKKSASTRDRFDIIALVVLHVVTAVYMHNPFAWLHAFFVRTSSKTFFIVLLVAGEPLYLYMAYPSKNLRRALAPKTEDNARHFRFYEIRWWKLAGHRLHVFNFYFLLFSRHCLLSRDEEKTENIAATEHVSTHWTSVPLPHVIRVRNGGKSYGSSDRTMNVIWPTTRAKQEQKEKNQRFC